jgi:hypothetical protein
MADPSPELVEHLGEALFVLSDRLRASGVLSSSDQVHDAYERVVAEFKAIEATHLEEVVRPDARVIEALENLLGQFDQAHDALGVERSTSAQNAIADARAALTLFEVRR